MSATTAAINPTTVAPAPAPSRPTPGSSDETRFDRHLDAARQQRDPRQEQPADESPAHATQQAKSAPAGKSADRHAAEAPAKDAAHADASTLAAAMLALIGHAVPVKPIALVAAATHAAAKAIAGAHATTAPGALAVLAGAEATVPAGKPDTTLDTAALAPLLAKPADPKASSPDMAQLANLSTATSSAPAAVVPTAAHALSIASPAGTPAFAQELGQQVTWLGGQDIKQARIRLHPEELGSMDVKVSINHDRVDVSFAVQHPAAVHVVQQTLPQLDTLLAQHGLALGQADVGQRQQPGEGNRQGGGNGTIGEIEGDSATLAPVQVSALGLLDTFA